MLRKILQKASFRRFSDAVSKEVIGIDFGASYAAVAVAEGDQARIIENNEGFRSTPCVVAFNKDGQKLVGSAAKRQALTNPLGTYTAIRQLLGRKIGDLETQDVIRSAKYKVVANNNNDAWIEDPKGEKISPVTIASHMFEKIKEGAEGSLNKVVAEAVVSVPSHFQETHRQAIKDAAGMAGIKVVKVIDEPIAVCNAYSVPKEEGRTMFVYDLGGDAFDAAVVNVKNGNFEVKEAVYDTHLGGDDIDTLLKQHFLHEFKIQSKIDLKNDPIAMQRVQEAAEKSKIELSSLVQSDINLPYLTSDASGPHHFSYIFKRSKMENLIDGFLKKTLTKCDEVLQKAGVQKTQVDEILLAGGAAKMPIVRTLVEQYFGKPTNKSISPDEAVALGTALEAQKHQGTAEQITLLDIVPLTIGIESVGGLFVPVFPQGTLIPTKRRFVIAPASTNQPSMMVTLYAGERARAQDNHLIGNFKVHSLYPTEKEAPHIEISLELTEQGIIKIQTKDLLTNNEQSFSAPSGLNFSNTQIEEAIQNAQKYAAADEQFKLEVQQRLDLDALVAEGQRDLRVIQGLTEEETNGLQLLLNKASQSLDSQAKEDYSGVKEQLTSFLDKIKSKVAGNAPESDQKAV
jgi:molecular chaperone DnaK